MNKRNENWDVFFFFLGWGGKEYMWFIYHCSLLASYHSDRKRLKIKHTQSLTEDIETKKLSTK
jgi:hypothetical protein